MPRIRIVAGLVLLGACTSSEVGSATQAGVYGTDDREEYYAAGAEMQRLTRESVVALVDAFDVDDSDPNDVRLLADDLTRSEGVCADVPFAEQPTPAFCSGTLIDDALILTAGHCFDDFDPDADCTGTRFVFDYHYTAPDVLATIRADEDVYSCDRVLVRRNVDLRDGALDYAIVRLDRSVSGHVPARVALTPRAVDRGDAMTMLGFPSGVPAKIDEGGRVYDARADTLDYFVTSNDAFSGNSGGGVFDSSGTLVGILFAGDDDWQSRGSCVVPFVLPESEGGSWSNYAAVAVEALCDTGFASTRLCPVAGSDAGATVDAGATADAGSFDAGPMVDAAFEDASGDASADADGGGGCACHVGLSAADASAWLFALVLFRRRLSTMCG